jgi:flagellar hook-basal body complex protein FliE
MPAPVNPIGLGPEFAVEAPQAPAAAPGQPAATQGTTSFGSMLSESMGKLQGLLDDASQQSAALAAGQAEDVTSVVMAVERAALGLQLAVQVRNKAVEAYQDVFRMQI